MGWDGHAGSMFLTQKGADTFAWAFYRMRTGASNKSLFQYEMSLKPSRISNEQ